MMLNELLTLPAMQVAPGVARQRSPRR